jgi:hypothetical protein
MKIKRFSEFIKLSENSDLDWSDKNWGEAGVDGENPPNSGLEGTSAEPMEYNAGDYGETAEEDEILDDSDERDIYSVQRSMDQLKGIKALLDDLTQKVKKIEKSKK